MFDGKQVIIFQCNLHLHGILKLHTVRFAEPGIPGFQLNVIRIAAKYQFPGLYPEYTRSAWLNVLKKEEMEKDDDKLYEELLSEYDALGLTWTGLYGFSNTYGLAVRQDAS